MLAPVIGTIAAYSVQLEPIAAYSSKSGSPTTSLLSICAAHYELHLHFLDYCSAYWCFMCSYFIGSAAASGAYRIMRIGYRVWSNSAAAVAAACSAAVASSGVSCS